jgi:cytoskeletal protein CcmA (bactofilin family)
MTFKGAVRIDGRFKGEIVSSDGTLIIGDQGVVESDIQVTNIVISGEVRGNIQAGNRIEIQSKAKVFGNIQGQSISIDEGAVF